MLKTFVVHGVGKANFFDLNDGRNILRLKRQETASWTISFDEVDVSGGDDLDLFETFETARTQSVAFTNNELDMGMFEAATGARKYVHYSAPIVEYDEGLNVPATGPYTYALSMGLNSDDSTVRIRYNDSREDLAPVPQVWGTANLAEITGAGFTLGDTVDIRITAVLPSGIESCATAVASITIVAATADIQVTVPTKVLDIPVVLPRYDVEISGFNIYVDDGTAPEYKSNATPIAAGGTHVIVATPGAGAGAPDATPTTAGQYTVTAGVVTFASADANVGVLIDFVWTTSAIIPQAETVDILSNCLRRWMSCLWSMTTTTKDGKQYRLQAVIHKMKYTGDFMIDFNRADASSHDLEFKVIDPERADKKIISWTTVDLGNSVPCS
jgi:hypothetical protein